MHIRKFSSVPYFVLFLLFFSYATAAALLFQNLLLPMAAGVHHGQGLIQGDSAYFHSVAVELAARIRAEGWGSWTIYPTHGSSGNVALLAALYVGFGDAPSLMVPVNAGLHALTGILIMALGRLLWPGRVGVLAGMLSAVLFVVFPSALNWYGQIHKDGFAIAGTMFVLVAWFWSERRSVTARSALSATVLFLIGCGLIVLVRPYGLRLLLAGAAIMALVEFLATWLAHKQMLIGRKQCMKLALLGLIAVLVAFTPKRAEHGDVSYAQWGAARSVALDHVQSIELPLALSRIQQWKWHETTWLPASLETPIRNVAHTRIGLIESGLIDGAMSMYDVDRLPQTSMEVLAYIPRALQVAIFAPFPSRWLEKLSAARLVSVVEMLTWYLLAPGVLLLFWYRRTPALLAVAALALTMLTIYGVALANVGTLYRIRYIYLFLLILLSLIGWLRFLEIREWLLPKATPGKIEQATVTPSVEKRQKIQQARTGLLNSGIIVAAVTAISFFGLFLRDVLMARMFGLGSELDAFVAGTVIPMFLVTVVSVPIGAAIVPIFLAERERVSPMAARALAQRIVLTFTAAAFVLALVVAMAGSAFLEIIGWSLVPDKAALAYEVTLWMLAIFIVSGLVTMANGVLNALGHYVVPAAAQAVVPVVVILALILAGGEHGVVVAAMAMLTGQLLNLGLVYRALAKKGESLVKVVREPGQGWGGFVPQYLPLMAAALFMQIGPPIGTAMASVLPEGSVAALGLGSKAVLFITGLTGAAITSVVLPYFSGHMAQNRLLDARRELSFLLLAGTIISIPITLGLHVFSGTFVSLLFEGGAFGATESELVSKVMAYGVLQLPFFVINILLLKFAIASRRSGRVMFASMIGLAVSVAFSLLLMTRMGVPGIALAMTFAAAASAAIMLLLFCRLGDVAWVDLLFIVVNWALFLTAMVCLHYASYAGAVSATFAFTILMLGEWTAVTQAKQS